jgi:hypothetical protein
MKIILASDLLRPTPLDLVDEDLQAIAQGASVAALQEAAEKNVSVFGRTPSGDFGYADPRDLLRDVDDQRLIQTCAQITDALRASGHDVAMVDVSKLERGQLVPGDCDMLVVDLNSPDIGEDVLSATLGQLVPTVAVGRRRAIEVVAERAASARSDAFLGSTVKPLSLAMLRGLVRSIEGGLLKSAAGSAVA